MEADSAIYSDLSILYAEASRQDTLSKCRNLLALDVVRVAVGSGECHPVRAAEMLLEMVQEWAERLGDPEGTRGPDQRCLAGAALCGFDSELRKGPDNRWKSKRERRAGVIVDRVSRTITNSYAREYLEAYEAAINRFRAIIFSDAAVARDFFVRSGITHATANLLARDIAGQTLQEAALSAIDAEMQGHPVNETSPARYIDFTDQLILSLAATRQMLQARDYKYFTFDLLETVMLLPGWRIESDLNNCNAGLGDAVSELAGRMMSRRERRKHVYQPFEWNFPQIKHARILARDDGAEFINEHHLFLGILHCQSRTRDRLESSLPKGLSLDHLREAIEGCRHHAAPPTPTPEESIA